MTYNFIEEYDIIVIGAGHAGVEASLAASRMGCKVLLATINIEMLAFMPCNPSIGGSAKEASTPACPAPITIISYSSVKL